jgi:hypothetical protein
MGAIANAFNEHLESLEPVDHEMDDAESHADSIEARLSESFDLKKFDIVGSHSRNSAISFESDVDYLAVLSRDEVRWGGSLVGSTTILSRVRDELLDRFSQTYVRKDGPAVVVHFSAGEFPVDVVPAYYLRPHPSGWPLYGIPDGADRWMQASPGYHNKYIRDADDRSKGRLHQVARLLKAWRGARTPSIPISSFHMEMVLAADATCERERTYRRCLEAAFRLLRDRQAAALRDPLRVSGDIAACRTDAQRQQTVIALELAANLAARALKTEQRGDEDEALELWARVFNGDFP